jgi:hypothetical protein
VSTAAAAAAASSTLSPLSSLSSLLPPPVRRRSTSPPCFQRIDSWCSWCQNHPKPVYPGPPTTTTSGWVGPKNHVEILACHWKKGEKEEKGRIFGDIR